MRRAALAVVALALAACQPSGIPTNEQLVAQDKQCKAAGLDSEAVRVKTIGDGVRIMAIQCAPVPK